MTYVAHGESAQIFIMRKTKLEVNFQAQDTHWDLINDFESKDHDPVIRNYLFNDFDSKSIVSIDVPFCNENEKVSKQLLNKFNVFTKEKYYFRTVWKRKRIWELFPL